ncbi:MAG: hypothetical protein K2Y37_17685 [Pirellulales bacterium]|nr:hypothetical protein [Pirellulales bacterium]
MTHAALQRTLPEGALGTRGVARGTLVLIGVTLVACLPAALLGNWLHGAAGVQAAVAAAGLCVGGAVLGLAAVPLFRGQRAFAGVLGAMLPRMFVPLTGALVLRIVKGPLYDAGALYFLIAFYLLNLAFETIWLLPRHTAGQAPLDRPNRPPQTA